MVRKFTTGVFLAFLLLLPAGAMAGFKATPIKINFDNRTKTAVLSVENDGDTRTTIQIEAMEWSQDENGGDQYKPAKDLIFFPKIMSVEKGEEKIVRVGYEGKFGGIEKTYRLFLQELPVRKEGDAAVSMALRMGLPVFVKPAAEETGSAAIESLRLNRGSVEVKVKNSGNSHIIVSKILAEGAGADSSGTFRKEIGGWYTLAGGSKTYSIQLGEEECLKSGEIKVQVTVGDKVVEGKLAVDKGACHAKS